MNDPIIMTNADYHASEAISKSDLDLINRSPAYYRYVKKNPREQTASMLFGSVVHSLVLEPEKFSDEYAVAPSVDKRTKKGREEWCEFAAASKDKTIIDSGIYDSAQLAALSVENNPIAKKLLHGGKAEMSYFWEEKGVKCKCRPDYLRTDIKCVIDLKTTQNANPDNFTKSAYDYRYHVQAAWYLRGLRSCGVDVENFIFIAVEKEAPYTVCIYNADNFMIKLGNTVADENLAVLCECIRSDNWYGYEETPVIHSLSLPDWVTRKYF